LSNNLAIFADRNMQSQKVAENKNVNYGGIARVKYDVLEFDAEDARELEQKECGKVHGCVSVPWAVIFSPWRGRSVNSILLPQNWLNFGYYA
jgi:hypothetical protein